MARDLDRLRAAVGDERLNYLGLSYGTLIGETYTTLFPDRVGAFVLDSPVDGDVWLNRPYEAGREQIAAFETAFARFLHWCTPQPVGLHARPGRPAGGLRRARRGAERHAAAGRRDRRRPARRGRQRDVHAVRLGAARPRDLRRGGGRREPRAGGSATASPSPGAFFAYVANENRWGSDVRRFLGEVRHQEATGAHFGFIRGVSFAGTTLWPWRARGVYRGPFRNAAAAPTPLVIGGTHDPATPYAWARRYVRDLGNARLLTYRSDGHGAVTDLNPCVGAAVLGYFEAGVLPPVGATCRQSVPAPGLRTAAREDLLAWKATTR